MNFDDMTTKELRDYVLANPIDDLAFYAFVDRKHQEVTNPLVIEPNDPEWEDKFKAIIQMQISKNT